jgi:hypothetical protein
MEQTIRFDGDGQKAFEVALQSLLPLGFRIERRDEFNLALSNSARYLNSRQNPLQGISRIDFTLRPGVLSVRTEMGALTRMVRVMAYLLAGMLAFFVLLFGTLWLTLAEFQGQPWILLLTAAPFIPWIFILPFMEGWLQRRTLAALETLLHNMTFDF